MSAAFLAYSAVAAESANFRVPAGFEVTRFAGDNLAHDIFAMTIYPRGDIVVSGPGYVKILRDENRDGVADSAKLFSPLPKTGAQGLYFDGSDLLASGDGAVLRFRDADGDGVADGPPEILRRNMANSEHGTHAIVQGPDGWFYVMCGNLPLPGAFEVSSTSSPVAEARQGTLLRFTRDFKTTEAVVHGFRNAYDFDFLPTGQLMVYDSDSERVHHLPGYAPSRVYDAAIGEHHGYMTLGGGGNGGGRAWIKPGYFPDGVDWIFEHGRGSPTGVVTYRHRQFPERYRHGLFMADWTLGVIYFLPLTPHGSTFDGAAEKFLVATGNDGFAPVDLVVGPSGDLFVAIGGRDTHGGVFRIHYAGAAPVGPVSGDALRQVLAADQPLDAWSRARWVPLARKLGAAPFEAASTDGSLSALERIRAIEVLVEVFGGIRPAVANQLAQAADSLIPARLAWALSRGAPAVEAHALLAKLTAQPAAIVQRAAWEGLLSIPPLSEPLVSAVDWRRGLGSDDRRVRRAAILTAQRAGFKDGPVSDADPARALDLLWLQQADAGKAAWMRQALAAFNTAADGRQRLEAVRLLQVGLGDVKVDDLKDECDLGFAAATALDKVDAGVRVEMARAITAKFPSGSRDLDQEMARLLGMLQADLPAARAGVAAAWTEASSSEGDLFFLHVAAQLKGTADAGTRRRIAQALAGLQGKIERERAVTDRLWPLRVKALFERLARADPEFPLAVVQDPAFGRADHSLFLPAMSGRARVAGAQKLLAAANRNPASWSSELVGVLAEALPLPEILPELRRRFDDPSLRDAIALVLTAQGDASDRSRLITALGSSLQPAVVEKIARKLASDASPAATTDLAVAIQALGRHTGTPAASVALDQLLAAWTGRPELSAAGGVTQDLFKPWLKWFTLAHPAEAGSVAAVAATSTEWMERLGKVDWNSGDPTRGRALFVGRGCAACHDVTNHFGPALAGIANRFNRDDLFLQIIDPNLSISPTYAAKEFTLRDGRFAFGVPVYESTAAVLLEIGPGNVIRLTSDQITRVAPTRRSPMPEGLLVGLSDSELADFYAYLKTLGAESPR